MEALRENILPNKGISFRCQQLTYSDLKAENNWHYNPGFESILFTNSEKTQFVGDSVNIYQPNDLSFWGPNIPHCWRQSDQHIKQKNPSNLIVTQFKKKSFICDFLALPIAKHIRGLFQGSSEGLKLRGNTADYIKQLLETMLYKSGLSKMLILHSVFDTQAISDETTPIASVDYRSGCDVNTNNLKKLKAIQNYSRDNLGNDIYPPDIAEKIVLTREAFIRFFKNTAGLTYIAFGNELGISKECRLLMEHESDITKISHECRHQTVSNFNRQLQMQKEQTTRVFHNKKRVIISSSDASLTLTAYG
ncbi:hypothetical protein [Paraglaciecola sp.]|uniref:hypothetical protein n=1 Tax=Paraglaciecola sp. TaxID=1920173 RepID=UPI003EF435B3